MRSTYTCIDEISRRCHIHYRMYKLIAIIKIKEDVRMRNIPGRDGVTTAGAIVDAPTAAGPSIPRVTFEAVF